MSKLDPDDRFQRVHIAADHRTVIEHTTIDLSDHDPVAECLEMLGVTTVSLRFVGGDTLSYSKRETTS